MSADPSRRRAIYAGRRASHAGPGAARIGMEGTKSTIAYRANPLWPGIVVWGGSCNCTRAPHQGVYQVKFRNADCPEHRRAA